MSTVFIGGSRRITRLDAEVKRRIDRIIEQHLPVLVGDASGADKAVQEYLRSKDYDLVEVFCSGGSCRNNTGGWPLRSIPVPENGKRKSFSFYATKDRAMAVEATVGLMLWDRQSVGTLMNVLRLLGQDKKTVVYVAPDHEFVEVRNKGDWEQLLSRCADELKQRIELESVVEQRAEREPSQARLL